MLYGSWQHSARISGNRSRLASKRDRRCACRPPLPSSIRSHRARALSPASGRPHIRRRLTRFASTRNRPTSRRPTWASLESICAPVHLGPGGASQVSRGSCQRKAPTNLGIGLATHSISRACLCRVESLVELFVLSTSPLDHSIVARKPLVPTDPLAARRCLRREDEAEWKCVSPLPYSESDLGPIAHRMTWVFILKRCVHTYDQRSKGQRFIQGMVMKKWRIGSSAKELAVRAADSASFSGLCHCQPR